MYHIVSKLMSWGLKNVIERLLSSNQTTFIPYRNMLDKVFVINELVDFTQRNKNYIFLFKVDFEMDFDSVS